MNGPSPGVEDIATPPGCAVTPPPPGSPIARFAATLTRGALLVAPLILAILLAVAVHQVPEPRGNDYGLHREGRKATRAEEQIVQARVAMLVVLEVFALTLLVRPWEFPWRARRWLAAFVVFVPWSGFMMAIAMHSGRLMALHALTLAGVVWVLLPVTIVLGIRSLVARRKLGTGRPHTENAAPKTPLAPGPPSAG